MSRFRRPLALLIGCLCLMLLALLAMRSPVVAALPLAPPSSSDTRQRRQPCAGRRLQPAGRQQCADRGLQRAGGALQRENGPGWTQQSRWLQAPVCGMFGQQPWYGVGCDCSTSWSPYKCRVVTVWLQENGLNGTVPAAFGGLSSLRTLVLKGNRLGGSNLDWLGRLGSLRTATLDGSGFGGQIPPAVGGLGQLQTLSPTTTS